MSKIILFTILFLSAALVTAEESTPPPRGVNFLTLFDTNQDGKVSQDEFFAALEKKFAPLDVDKNGILTVQELQIYAEKDVEAKQKARHALHLDIPQERSYSESEFNQLVTERAEQEFIALDKNRDNQLNADEIGLKKKPVKKNAKKKDTAKQVAGEKTVLKEDFIALFNETAEQKFFALDRDYDGMLTAEELGLVKLRPRLMPSTQQTDTPPVTDRQAAEKHKLIKSFFSGIDANHDTIISNDEKIAAFKRFFNRLDTNLDGFVTPTEIAGGRQAAQ
jgi:Ca2+-binding EF-hand superfamily protein